MEQTETSAPKEQGGAPAERNPPETSEEPKFGIGILPPKMGSESSGSSASQPPNASQASGPMAIPASGFDPVQSMPQPMAVSSPFGSPAFAPVATGGGATAASAPAADSHWPGALPPHSILPPPAAGQPSAQPPAQAPYAGHEAYQYDQSGGGQSQENWQQMMGHPPMPTSYPLYAPPSYEIGSDYSAARTASGGYAYGTGMQQQTAYPQLYDPSYQMQQNQRLLAAGYGQYARSQSQGSGGHHYDRSGDRRRQRSREDPDSARDPGPPIGHHLRGPDGANLFVFHIPNTMTNQDLYNLFSRYGNVLSATIKTEGKTGRGRGFGFVNYDNPESAASAIHHLNGAAVSSHNQVCMKCEYFTQEFLLTFLFFFLFR